MSEAPTSSDKYPNLSDRVHEVLYTLSHPRSQLEIDVFFGALGAFLGGVATGGSGEGIAAGAALSTLLKPTTNILQKDLLREDVIVPDHILKVLYNSAKSFATGQSPLDK